jgi:hypothetical protein
LVHDRVAAGFDDFRAFDRAVAVDVDFDGADEGFVLLEDGGGLLPLAEKAVVDEVVIPTELTGGAAASGFRGGAGSGCCAAGCFRFGEGFLLGVVRSGVGFLFRGWGGVGFWGGFGRGLGGSFG